MTGRKTKERSMSDQDQVPYETQEGDSDETQEVVGTSVVDSDDIEDQYELVDVVEADYYGTDDDDAEAPDAADEVTA
jgi:hypothetical protein